MQLNHTIGVTGWLSGYSVGLGSIIWIILVFNAQSIAKDHLRVVLL